MPLFEKHFSVEEANAMLPELRVLLADVRQVRDQLSVHWEGAIPVLKVAGSNGGGASATACVVDLLRLNQLARSIASRGVLIKDIDRGLVDFPHLRDDREVLLCWESSEEQVAYWHDLDNGYAGRQPID
jgi:hypothetical protein